MYVQLFVWMDGYTGECMHVPGYTRGRWMLIGFLLAKMCCFLVKRLKNNKNYKKDTLYKSTSGSALSV